MRSKVETWEAVLLALMMLALGLIAGWGVRDDRTRAERHVGWIASEEGACYVGADGQYGPCYLSDGTWFSPR